MSPAGLGPENDCAGEGQQQLQTTAPSSCSASVQLEKKNLAVNLKGFGAKTN
jgi:hypothetical protein